MPLLDALLVPPPPPPVDERRHGRRTADTAIESKTTAEEDRKTAGQRRINVIWEATQAVVTILITFAAIYCAIQKIDAQVLNFAFVAVISTYYARTNHTKEGGVGVGATYTGR